MIPPIEPDWITDMDPIEAVDDITVQAAIVTVLTVISSGWRDCQTAFAASVMSASNSLTDLFIAPLT